MNRLFAFACVASLMLACPAIAVAARPAATSADPHVQALLDLETERLAASVAGNIKLLDTLVADDAVYIHANGAVQDKTARLRDIESGASRYRSIETSQRSAQFYNNIAVTHGHIVLNIGADRRIAGIYTGLYIERAGRWLLLSWQTTPITPRR